MRFRFLGFVGLAVCASAANADVGYCHANFRQNFFFTEVIELPEGTEYVSVHRMFQDWIERRTDRTASGAECNSFSSRAEAESMRAKFLHNLAAAGNPVEIVSGFPGNSAQQSAVKEVRKPSQKGPNAAEIAANERAARAAEREAEFQRKQADYEAKLAEQKRQVDDFNRANADIARKKAEQVAAVKAAEDAFRKEQEAHAELMRQHEAEVAKYESELAASKVRADFDKRHGLGKASTDTDANRCVTTAETKLNDTFKGNTSASIINGCGQPVDVRICLMTDKGWNCGVRWGVGSQAQASFSAFNATGQVFVDAKITGSDKALASPN